MRSQLCSFLCPPSLMSVQTLWNSTSMMSYPQCNNPRKDSVLSFLHFMPLWDIPLFITLSCHVWPCSGQACNMVPLLVSLVLMWTSSPAITHSMLSPYSLQSNREHRSGDILSKVTAYIRKLSGCNPLAQSLHQLLYRNEVGTRTQKVIYI